MSALHEHARAAGLERLVLETGMLQPEACALYEACGYTLVDNYGPYVTDPVSLCYALPLGLLPAAAPVDAGDMSRTQALSSGP
jgi:hypothetical protein